MDEGERGARERDERRVKGEEKRWRREKGGKEENKMERNTRTGEQ